MSMSVIFFVFDNNHYLQKRLCDAEHSLYTTTDAPAALTSVQPVESLEAWCNYSSSQNKVPTAEWKSRLIFAQ